MSRKTIEVEKLVQYANEQLKYGMTGAAHRGGVTVMIEEVLFRTGNYGGFRFLRSDEVPNNQLPGVHYKDGQLLPYPERFFETDNTRREYFLK